MILGIDPGLSGALALYDGELNVLDVYDMPTIQAGRDSKKVVDEDALSRLVDEWAHHIRHAFVEHVSAMPGQGVTSMFSFGSSFGLVKGILAANFIPRTLVKPAVWKKSLGVPAAKEGARARASQLLPAHGGKWLRVKDDGRAEAALIAMYGWQQWIKTQSTPTITAPIPAA